MFTGSGDQDGGLFCLPHEGQGCVSGLPPLRCGRGLIQSVAELTLLPHKQPQSGSPLFQGHVGFLTSVCLLSSSAESST